MKATVRVTGLAARYLGSKSGLKKLRTGLVCPDESGSRALLVCVSKTPVEKDGH